jgi:hypothetical protein
MRAAHWVYLKVVQLLLGHSGVDVNIADVVRSSANTPASYPSSKIDIYIRMTQQQQQQHHLQVAARYGQAAAAGSSWCGCEHR